eukprot:6188378-Pleurochrysis_carterae.AAC.1
MRMCAVKMLLIVSAAFKATDVLNAKSSSTECTVAQNCAECQEHRLQINSMLCSVVSPRAYSASMWLSARLHEIMRSETVCISWAPEKSCVTAASYTTQSTFPHRTIYIKLCPFLQNKAGLLVCPEF